MELLLHFGILLIALALVGAANAWAAYRGDGGEASKKVEAVMKFIASGSFLLILFIVNYFMASRGLTFLTENEVIHGIDATKKGTSGVADPIGWALIGRTNLHLGSLMGLVVIWGPFVLMGFVTLFLSRLYTERKEGWQDWVRLSVPLLLSILLAVPVVMLDMILLVMRMAMALNPGAYYSPHELPPIGQLVFPPQGEATAGHSVLQVLLIAYPILIFVAEMSFGRALGAVRKAFDRSQELEQQAMQIPAPAPLQPQPDREPQALPPNVIRPIPLPEDA